MTETGPGTMAQMQQARDALAGIYDPCCREKGISVLEMGLVRSVQVEDGVAKVELLLTSGWCPFAASVLTEVKDQILAQPGISDADKIAWRDERPWLVGLYAFDEEWFEEDEEP